MTALTDRIGYERAAAIGKLAYERGLPILDAAAMETELDRETLETLLDPEQLTHSE